MATVATQLPRDWTIADLQEHLGWIPAQRIRLFFQAGMQLVWYVDTETRTVTVHTGIDASTELNESQTITGESLLPGLEITVRQLFESPGQPTGPVDSS